MIENAPSASHAVMDSFPVPNRQLCGRLILFDAGAEVTHRTLIPGDTRRTQKSPRPRPLPLCVWEAS